MEPGTESHREVDSNLTKVRTLWILKLYIYGNVVSGNGELLSLEIFKLTGENLVEKL